MDVAIVDLLQDRCVSGVWGNMGLSGGCLRKSKTAGVSLLV
ncbi:unnamed protein product [Ectocarpus sp. CCAP 1310/34]|nr:unnamed protein product [Ectocarpus sp. CCAP 1310/34]